MLATWASVGCGIAMAAVMAAVAAVGGGCWHMVRRSAVRRRNAIVGNHIPRLAVMAAVAGGVP